MACFLVHLMVDNLGYLLWLVSQVWVCLVSEVGVICVITAVFVFINYSRFIFLEVLACIYLVGFIVLSLDTYVKVLAIT